MGTTVTEDISPSLPFGVALVGFRQPFSVIGFKIELSFSSDVRQMLANSRKGVGGLRKYHHHDFGRTANRPGHLLHFSGRQVISPTGTSPGKTE